MVHDVVRNVPNATDFHCTLWRTLRFRYDVSLAFHIYIMCIRNAIRYILLFLYMLRSYITLYVSYPAYFAAFVVR